MTERILHEAAVHVENLEHAYDTNSVLRDVSFTVQKGQVVGLLGSNGAGKTTLTRLISTFLPIQRGRCAIAGYDCSRASLQVRRQIAVIPQGSTLNLELTVEQNILTYLLLHGLVMAEAVRRLAVAVERFGLGPYLKRPCMELSGGFRRRVQVARAFSTDAKVLLLDEASVGLDPVARRNLWSMIRETAGERTVLLTTQNLDEAEICNSLLFLQGGRIVADGTPAHLKAVHGRAQLTVTLKSPVSMPDSLRNDLDRIGARLVSESGDRLVLSLENGAGQQLGEIVRMLYAHQLPVTQTAVSPPSLEDVFVALSRRQEP